MPGKAEPREQPGALDQRVAAGRWDGSGRRQLDVQSGRVADPSRIPLAGVDAR
jgi:hypothetical protein